MSVEHYYHMCHRYKGRPVEIRTKDGNVHRGIIQRVNQRKVYLTPLTRRSREIGGFGYGFYGPGFGWGYGGLGVGIALGAIGTLALLPFFLW